MNRFTRGAIIPHAGKQYSGLARKTALQYLPKSSKYIIYLAALHQLDNSNHIYLLESDPYFQSKLDRSKLPIIRDTNIINTEHSYQWVEPELRDYFNPDAIFLAIAPSNGTDLQALTDWLVSIFTSDTVLIATTDLTHYGKQFHNSPVFNYPEQLDKLEAEEALMIDLISTNTNALEERLSATACGAYAIMTFIKFAIKMDWLGRVVDYYDSHAVTNKKNTLDLYCFDLAPVTSFVSYASIIYGNYPVEIYYSLLPVDIYLSLGIFKSIIRFQKSKNIKRVQKVDLGKFKIPKWSSLAKLKNGVFMGTILNSNTNCCTGIFESKLSTRKNLNKASQNCYHDAMTRWNLPYQDINLDQLSYKLDILDPITSWKEYPSNRAEDVFNMNGRYGMQIQFKTGENAIFIPEVAKDHRDSWDIKTYMRHLTLKAYHTNNSKLQDNWKLAGGLIKVFSTKTYTFNPLTNKLEIN